MNAHLKFNQNFWIVLLASVSLFFWGYCIVYPRQVQAQDNPVLAPEVLHLPSIDGRTDDSCWQNIPWQNISQVWIPYGGQVDSNDYSGHYKVLWSSQTNLLYFLVEVTDNVFVDGFVPERTPEVYNFDIIEVFLDEDKSGGLQVFDGKDSLGLQWGTNAENAFSYHMYALFPKEGEVTSHLFAGDIAGTNWSDINRLDYNGHFPEFALRRTGNKAIWEFSLIVYNDTYADTMIHKESARSTLFAGKIMGLSLAYCDNDHPEKEPKSRDSFYGSVWVPAPAYNDHWMNADYFGTIKLIGNNFIKDSNHH
jgi:hypothetical protein